MECLRSSSQSGSENASKPRLDQTTESSGPSSIPRDIDVHTRNYQGLQACKRQLMIRHKLHKNLYFSVDVIYITLNVRMDFSREKNY